MAHIAQVLRPLRPFIPSYQIVPHPERSPLCCMHSERVQTEKLLTGLRPVSGGGATMCKDNLNEKEWKKDRDNDTRVSGLWMVTRVKHVCKDFAHPHFHCQLCRAGGGKAQ